MISSAALLFAFAQGAPPRELVSVRETDGELVVDARRDAVEPLELLQALAAATGRTLEGASLLVDRARFDVALEGRSIESVLDLVGCATRTRIALGRRAITILAERTSSEIAERALDAEAAWVALIRDFPEHEASRVARVELGRRQESLGQDDAALTHYDAATRTNATSAAAEQALAAAGDLLIRRGEWNEAMRRFSRLAQAAQDESMQVRARLSLARALAELGRGSESLALVDVVDLSYPPRDDDAKAERRLARARAELASGSASGALRQLDLRAASDLRRGAEREDLSLRARALEELDAPLEASRAWIACASVSGPLERADAYAAAARLAALGGDDLAVLFIERLARNTPRAADVVRHADTARARLGLATEARDAASLEARWKDRARLAEHERAAIAALLVAATARERGADAAAVFADAATDELPGNGARAIRRALAIAYENEGAWADAARAWGGSAP